MDNIVNLVPQTNELEVVQLRFVDSSFTNADELFSGFDHLRVITFAYSLGFVTRMLKHFKTVEIILGNEAMVKYDAKEVMAFQTAALKQIHRHEELISRVKDGTARIWIAKEILAHEKIFILSSDNGRTRIIVGSANFTARAFSGNQREFIGYFDNDSLAYDYYQREYDFMLDTSTNEVIEESVYASTDDEKVTEHLPIIQEAIAKEAGIILNEAGPDDEQMEFITDVSILREHYAKSASFFQREGGLIKLTPQKAHELIRTERKQVQEEKAKKKVFPQFIINYEDCSASMNGKPFDLAYTPDAVKDVLKRIDTYFSGYDFFIGDSQQAKCTYFKVLNYMLLSPFMATLRYTAEKNGFSNEYFPYFVVLYGRKSAGKTAFVSMVQILMFGRDLGKYEPSNFTPSRIERIIRSASGVPCHINDITKKRFNEGSSETLKCDDWIISEKLTTHPTFVITTNEVDAIRSDYNKRVYLASIDLTLDNVTAASMKKKVYENSRKMTNAFYRCYLQHMIPLVAEMIAKMKAPAVEDNVDWVPDIFALSSKVILNIYEEIGMTPPAYVQPLQYSDYFGSISIGQKAKDQILRDWRHNPENFRMLKKQNQLVYDAGEHGYDADNLIKILPEVLEATRSGTKVVMLLDKAEEFFGVKFKRRLFNR